MRRTSIAAMLAIAFCAHAAAGADGNMPLREILRRARLPGDAQRLRDLQYAKVGDTALRLDLFLPTGKDANGRPVVVWIHGGGWRAGDKANCPAVGLVNDGFAVASINYRLTGISSHPAQIEDCKGAIRWLRAHAEKYNLDPNRFGVAGASAGGHLAALLGTSGGVKELEGNVGDNLDQSSRVQAVLDCCGPADLVEMLKRKQRRRNDPNSPESKLLGGPIAERMDLGKAASPVTYVDPNDPPFLIIHGDSDPVVPLEQAKIMHAALQKAGVPSELMILKNFGHGGAAHPEALVRSRSFFLKYLQGPRPK